MVNNSTGWLRAAAVALCPLLWNGAAHAAGVCGDHAQSRTSGGCAFQATGGRDVAAGLVRVGTTVIVNSPSSTVIVNNPAPPVATRPALVVVATSPPPSFVFKPQELLPYLSPRCAELNEAIRRGPVRGSRSQETIAGMRDEYQSRCQDDEREARERLYRDKIAQRNDLVSQKTAAAAASNQAKLTRDQCDEMLRILVARRKRLDGMSDGERNDHQRFESNYVARCKSG